MTQLRLVYSRIKSNDSAQSGNLPFDSLALLPESLTQKLKRLHRLRPDVAAVIERLVEDVLADTQK